MDAITGFLRGPRAQGAFLLRTVVSPPWSVRIEDEAPLTVVALVRGEAWFVLAGDDPVVLRAGDVAIVRGPEPYTVANEPDTPPQVIILPGQRCTTPDGVEMSMRDLDVRTWGNSPEGATAMLTGTYQGDGEIGRRLLCTLPTLVVLRSGEWDCPVVPLLADEIGKDDLGQEVVLDRLLDLLVIAVLRAWFAGAGGRAPAWYRAHADPVVGPAVTLLHDAPDHPWTVAELAGRVGVSRAALARRFHELVGEPPMAYLTGWRLALAADLLHEPEATVAGVSRKVGYASPFTFSTAFKRRYGVSPQAYRTRAA